MKIAIVKYDPSIDSAPHEEAYEVPHKDKMTALEVINYVHENHEAIAFDYACRGRACGRCAIMFDGEPTLACVTPVDDSNHRIAPLSGLPVIRDLTVDRHGLHERLSYTRKRIRAHELTDEDFLAPVSFDEYEKLDPLEWCARCGVCNAGCPVLNTEGGKSSYIGPAGMIAIAHRHYDPYDDSDRIIQALQEGLYACIQCGKCDEVCSAKEINHLKVWKDLRAEAEERNLV